MSFRKAGGLNVSFRDTKGQNFSQFRYTNLDRVCIGMGVGNNIGDGIGLDR